MPIDGYLAELADMQKPVVHSKLLNLSSLSKEELEEVGIWWAGLELRRRRRVMKALVDVAEDNVEADYEGVFRLCLDDQDAGIRINAIDGLWECSSRWLLNRLIDLQDSDPSLEVRVAATSALERFCLMAELGELRVEDAERLQDKLFGLFGQEEEDSSVRRRALEAASPLSTPKVNDLIRQAYHSDDTELKLGAIYAIGRHSDSDWLPVLLLELKNRDEAIRYEAAKACGELEDERSIPHLIILLNDEDPQVRQAATQALGHIGGREAISILRDCLSSTDPGIRQAAEEALEYTSKTGDAADPS
ncbi:MAG: phycocyanin alpha phycocyanobilin lyase [Dehalococcoidia bacterium]|nr:phycocyanin alpha phycocyanobilin lyase [Dehalococcoidia bacterium]